MSKLMKTIIVAVLMLLIIISIQRTVNAFQYEGDIRIQKVWLTESQIEENIKAQNNKKIYLKYEEILKKVLNASIILASVITTYLVIYKKINLKWYYIFLIILTFLYIFIKKYLQNKYLGSNFTVNNIIYVDIALIVVGILIGIFAEGKVQKVLMSSTPAFIVLLLGLVGNNVKGVLQTVLMIELFVQIILLPQYCIKKTKEESVNQN